MRKALALFLCLILALAPCVSVLVSAETDDGYTFDADSKTYTVYTADGLLAVNALINDGKLDHNVTLAADIDLTGKTYVQIGSETSKLYYTGTFDGAGHTITGLSVDDAAGTNGGRFFGLISACSSGMVVKNVTFVNPYIVVLEYGGCILGRSHGDFTVSNCHILGGYISTGKNYVAGFVGRLESGTSNVLFENCTVQGLKVQATQSASLLLGGESGNSDLTVTFRNIVAEGILNDTNANTSRMSALIGYMSGLTLNCENCVCLPTFDHAYTDYGALAGVAAKANINYTNCIGNTGFSGGLTVDKRKTVVTDCVVYDATATQDGGEVALLNVAAPATITDTLTIDGETAEFATAKLSAICGDTLLARTEEMFADDAAFQARALEIVNAKVHEIKLIGFQQTKVEDGKVSVRVIGGLNTIHFEKVVYAVTVQNGDATYNVSEESDTVYSSIRATDVNGEPIVLTAADLDAAYLTALRLINIPATGTYTFTVSITAMLDAENSVRTEAASFTVTDGVLEVQ